MAENYDGVSLDGLRALVMNTTPATIHDAATHWGKVNAALTDLANDLDRNRLGLLESQGWSGSAAENFYTYTQDLISRIQQVASGASTASTALGTLAGQVTTAQQRMREIPQPPPLPIGPFNAAQHPDLAKAQAETRLAQQRAAQVMNTMASQYDQAHTALSGIPAELPATASDPSQRIAGPTGSSGTSGSTGGTRGYAPGAAHIANGGGTRLAGPDKQREARKSEAAIAVPAPTGLSATHDGPGQQARQPAGPPAGSPAGGVGTPGTPQAPGGFLPAPPPGGRGGPAGTTGGPAGPGQGGDAAAGRLSPGGPDGTPPAPGGQDGVVGGRLSRVGGPHGGGLPADGISGGTLKATTGGLERVGGMGAPEAGRGLVTGGEGGMVGGGSRMSAGTPADGVGLASGGPNTGGAGAAGEGTGMMPMGGGGVGAGEAEQRGKRPRYLREDPSTWEHGQRVNPAVIE